ncbi:carboxymuconolactone decarboxylase family protein [Streptomyces sp. NPDC003758]|uniref:Carboxymuconolactone decarboxylase family protein n=1 Tax=Streptomyces cynarae TaxID=2981134 RepID=A0ABY6E0Z1_9ACTN|nr:carboxymuconolactone decarboxylase family protein [Streptomyces cynarae]UXY17758.1 carboxymuconolactone decarboxylase family protein [Streptomyces cynarae]
MANLVTSGSADRLRRHPGRAKDNGASEAELIEAITHLTFCTGRPCAMTAVAVTKDLFRG